MTYITSGTYTEWDNKAAALIYGARSEGKGLMTIKRQLLQSINDVSNFEAQEIQHIVNRLQEAACI